MFLREIQELVGKVVHHRQQPEATAIEQGITEPFFLIQPLNTLVITKCPSCCGRWLLRCCSGWPASYPAMLRA